MKFIGFWKEYTKKETDPSIQDFLAGNKFPTELEMNQIIDYLKAGKFILSDRLVTRSTVTNERFDPHTIYTDGEWIWTSALIYYINKMNIEPPKDFLRHINSKTVLPKNLDFSKEILSELSDRAYKRLS
jgi:hypothetical protein